MASSTDSLYSYNGPILRFGKPVASRWKAQTIAPTAAKAKSNLTWQAKRSLGLAANAPVTLPGKISLVS